MQMEDFVPKKKIPQVTFDELSLPKKIDYVSLDVEGFEKKILDAFPWGTHCSKLWTIEGAGSNSDFDQKSAIESKLGENGCELDRQSADDGFFKCNCEEAPQDDWDADN